MGHDFGMPDGKRAFLQDGGVEGRHVVVTDLLGFFGLVSQFQGVRPSFEKGVAGVQSVLQVQGVGEVSYSGILLQLVQKFVFPHLGDLQAAGIEVSCLLFHQEVKFGHGLSDDGVLGPAPIVGITDGAFVPETPVVLEDFVAVGIVSVHPIRTEFLLALLVECVSYVYASSTGRPLQSENAVLGELTAAHVALGRDGGHGEETKVREVTSSSVHPSGRVQRPSLRVARSRCPSE